mmetsp:Transcript_59230/g.152397  ORF Transcript_59230/g.152397 Transcript_59230/m.152397 type:complete len:429 (+) Transcript_59230:965-2251(+)
MSVSIRSMAEPSPLLTAGHMSGSLTALFTIIVLKPPKMLLRTGAETSSNLAFATSAFSEALAMAECISSSMRASTTRPNASTLSMREHSAPWTRLPTFSSATLTAVPTSEASLCAPTATADVVASTKICVLLSKSTVLPLLAATTRVGCRASSSDVRVLPLANTALGVLCGAVMSPSAGMPSESSEGEREKGSCSSCPRARQVGVLQSGPTRSSCARGGWAWGRSRPESTWTSSGPKQPSTGSCSFAGELPSHRLEGVDPLECREAGADPPLPSSSSSGFRLRQTSRMSGIDCELVFPSMPMPRPARWPEDAAAGLERLCPTADGPELLRVGLSRLAPENGVILRLDEGETLLQKDELTLVAPGAVVSSPKLAGDDSSMRLKRPPGEGIIGVAGFEQKHGGANAKPSSWPGSSRSEKFESSEKLLTTM